MSIATMNGKVYRQNGDFQWKLINNAGADYNNLFSLAAFGIAVYIGTIQGIFSSFSNGLTRSSFSDGLLENDVYALHLTSHTLYADPDKPVYVNNLLAAVTINKIKEPIFHCYPNPHRWTINSGDTSQFAESPCKCRK